MNKSIKLIINYVAGPALFILLSWSLYRQILNQPDLQQRWNHIKESWRHGSFWLVILLMFINWGIESRKWQLLIMPLQKFSFLKSFKSVLAGCSITMLTPNRIGEYGGRIIYVDEAHRLKAISLTILGSISQLFITILMGAVGLLAFKFLFKINNNIIGILPELVGNILIYLSIIAAFILFIFYFRAGWLIKIISSIPFFKKFKKYLTVVQVFTDKQLLTILFLSFLRYMVFILQYVLLLQLMEVNVSIILSFWLLTIFYLIMALAPTIGFTELPVRAVAIVGLFQYYSSNVLGIQAAAFGIWVINLVIPAIIGSILFLSIKIMKNDEKIT